MIIDGLEVPAEYLLAQHLSTGLCGECFHDPGDVPVEKVGRGLPGMRPAPGKGLPRLGSIDRIVVWHNQIRPHTRLDYDEPYHVLRDRLLPERIMGYMNGW